MAADDVTENTEGPRRRTYTPPADDAVFTGSFPVVDASTGSPSLAQPVPPTPPSPTAALAPPVRRSLSDAEILARFSGHSAGSTAEMITELERQVTLREEEDEAFEMWANLTRATRGAAAGDIIARERIIFNGGTPEPVVDADNSGAPADATVATDDRDVLDADMPEDEVPEPVSASEVAEEIGLDSDSPVVQDIVENVPEDVVSDGESADEVDTAQSEPSDGDESEHHWPLAQSAGAAENSDSEQVVVPESDAASAADVGDEKVAVARGPVVDRVGLEATADNQKTLTRVGLFWLWWATLTPAVGIVAGAFFVSRGLGLLESVVAVSAGALISGLVIAASSYAGARTGLSSLHTAQATFGRIGNVVPSVVLVVIRVAVLALMITAAESLITRVVTLANWWPFELWMLRTAVAVLVAASVISVGLLGGRVLRVALYVSAGLSTLGIIAFIVLTAPVLSMSVIDPWGSPVMSVVAMGSLAHVGFMVLFGHTGGDLARYHPGNGARSVSALSGLVAVVPSILFVSYVVWALSAAPALATTWVTDPVGSLSGLVPSWYPVPVMVALALPLILLSALMLFSGGLAVLSAGLPVSRLAGTALVALLALGSAATAIGFGHRVSQYFPDILYLIGVPLVAWGAAYALDVALGSHRLNDVASGSTPTVRVAPLAGFVLASALGWGLISSNIAWLSWLGFVFPLADLAGLIDVRSAQPGIVVALVVSAAVSAIAALGRKIHDRELVDG
jgi:nucleobase:cation symporter-1, NCS1 family